MMNLVIGATKSEHLPRFSLSRLFLLNLMGFMGFFKGFFLNL